MASYEEFKTRCNDNFNNRCLHHHVFNTQLAVKLVNYMNLQIIDVAAIKPVHILILAQKLPLGIEQNNAPFMDKNLGWESSGIF